MWDETPNLTTGLGAEDREELLCCTAPLKILGLVVRNVGNILGKMKEPDGSPHGKRKVREGYTDTRKRKDKSARIEHHLGDSAVKVSENMAKDANLKAAKADDAGAFGMNEKDGMILKEARMNA